MSSFSFQPITRVLVFGSILILGACRAESPTPNTSDSNASQEASNPGEAEEVQAFQQQRPTSAEDKHVLVAQRQELDETVWRQEVVAQQYEQALVQLWDALLDEARVPDGDELSVLANHVRFNEMQIGSAGPTEQWDHGITVAPLNKTPRNLSESEWKGLVGLAKTQGYRIVQTEWHHAEFDMHDSGQARSKISMAIYARHTSGNERVVIRGNLEVIWRPRPDPKSIPVPDRIDTTDLEILRQQGSVAFEKVLTIDHASPSNRAGIQPIITYDLNDDGLSEILLVGSNELLWNEGEGNFSKRTLCTHRERGFETALAADLTGDGNVDLLLPGRRGDLLLYQGDQGHFSTPPLGKAREGGPLIQPQVMTAGDIDKDGDLDLWIGQYKIAYIGGQMPTPYYDANDGFPAYLLFNDGKGRFSPATEETGLAEKRFRRSYGGSFVDLDTDGDLDLLVVSDFAGVDLYQNDGSGYFRDVTEETFDDRHLFGMSVSFADFDLDGRTDLFVTGMASTTARRLEHMRLGRVDRPDIHLMRSRMGYGNRMYLSQSNRFVQPEFRDQVARTGWSWGSTAFDFDNDSDVDIYVANGHSSGKSTKDHCTHFWCHDIYEGDSKPNPANQALFQDVLAGYFDRSESWDGYQKNSLLMNQEGSGFESIAFLLGVGQEFDGRAVISDDIDGDGRMDLLVIEDQWNDGQRLHIFRNQLDTGNHWVGIRLQDEPGHSVLGCRVTVDAAGKKRTREILAGDSIHAQHAPTAHFGLGATDKIDAIEVSWIDGHVERITSPACDQYHVISRSSAAKP